MIAGSTFRAEIPLIVNVRSCRLSVILHFDRPKCTRDVRIKLLDA